MLIIEGGDQISIILTLLLIPIRLLDSRKNSWLNTKTQITLKRNFLYYNAKYSLLFIGIQMAILYVNAGIAKMFTTEWGNGTAIYYWFNDNVFGAPEWMKMIVGDLFTFDITVTIINWSVIFLELTIFISIFLSQGYKNIVFILAVAFHFSIVLIHGLPTFFLAMTAGLVLFLLRLDKSIGENISDLYNSILSVFRKKNEGISKSS